MDAGASVQSIADQFVSSPELENGLATSPSCRRTLAPLTKRAADPKLLVCLAPIETCVALPEPLDEAPAPQKLLPLRLQRSR